MQEDINSICITLRDMRSNGKVLHSADPYGTSSWLLFRHIKNKREWWLVIDIEGIVTIAMLTVWPDNKIHSKLIMAEGGNGTIPLQTFVSEISNSRAWAIKIIGETWPGSSE